VSVILQELAWPESEKLLPLLNDAEEDEQRVRARLTDSSYTTYAALDDKQLVGAATVHWQSDESEIEYIAVDASLRGQGYGKAIIALLLQEARRRRVQSLLVGTASSALNNLIFYQKCGFRVDHVRRDFFSYIQPPIMEHGVLMRAMLVLRYELLD
jgi:N-acetylglutamate synthase-like GNAT family acetyltransferase